MPVDLVFLVVCPWKILYGPTEELLVSSMIDPEDPGDLVVVSVVNADT